MKLSRGSQTCPERRFEFAISLVLLQLVFLSVVMAQDTAHWADDSVLVMSFNLRWDGIDDGPNNWSRRRDAVISLIQSHHPDIIGFQEPSRRQSRDLAGGLLAYRIVVDSHDQSLGIPIAVRTNRFDVRASGSFWLVDSSPLEGGTRRCTWLRLFDKKTTREIFVYNAHLDGRDQAAHLVAVMKLQAHILQRNPPVPFIITGDFNQIETGPGIRFLTGTSPNLNQNLRQTQNPLRLVDTFRRIHTEKTGVGTGHGFTGKTDGGRIDYIFVGQESKVLDASILREKPFGVFPSDHFPVTARVLLRHNNSIAVEDR